MNAPQTKAQERIASATTGKADDLSLKLFQITEIVKLAAFAAESRRVLESITNAAIHLPEIEKFIDDSVKCPHTWKEMSDSTGNVLDYVSRQLDIVNKGFLNTVYDLADGKASGTGQIGGAA